MVQDVAFQTEGDLIRVLERIADALEKRNDQLDKLTKLTEENLMATRMVKEWREALDNAK